MVTTRAEAARQLKDAEGLKLVVFGADGHEIAAMFVQGSVNYDEEEATFIAVAEDGHPVGQLFVDETVGYDENTDSFVIRTAPAARPTPPRTWWQRLRHRYWQIRGPKSQ